MAEAPQHGQDGRAANSRSEESAGSVELADPDGRLGPDARDWLARQAGAAMGLLNARGEVRVKVVGDAEMSAAHEEFLGEAGTTDVLTFDMTPPDEPLDVDILICADEAARQAAPRGHAPQQELLLYIVHGLLHCLGHDDHDPADAARMHAEEDRILESLGVGATYSRPAGAEGRR
jgi:probable rRNA maturation factor